MSVPRRRVSRSVNHFVSSCPSEIPSDCAEISRRLPLLEDERHHLESASASISKVLETVNDQRQKLAQKIALYKALLEPIYLLPLELLQEIFLYGYPSDDDEEVYSYLWDLERVSRRWRHAALGCGKLWSRICITSDMLRCHKVRDPLKMIDTWLTRSRQCGLDITFGHFYDRRDPSAFSLFSPLLQQCHRWRSLELHISFDPSIFAALESMRGRFPMLQSLNITHEEWHREITNIEAFCGAPNLSSMHLRFGDRLRMHATLNSLTSLTISHSDILLHLTLPHLKNLTIEDEEDYYDEEEEDDDDENPRSKILSTILTFVQRSSCVLKSLELPRPTTLISHDAEELFRSLPQLKRLVSEIYGRDNFNNFVACFSISEKSVPLPELEELDLRPYPSPTDSAISLLLEITEARRKRGQGITKMEKLSLRNCEIPLSPALVKKAKRLQDDGAAITLRDRRDEIAFPNVGTLEQVKSVGFPLLPRFSGGGH